jgi:ParB-like chromosome segregation protein Spo0J
MKIETRSIDSLRPDSRNARKHGTRNLATIRASLEQFGQQRAAVIRSDGTVLAGNGMLEAARELGWIDLAVTVVPDEWSEEQARAYALADNRTGELAEWDVAVLDEHIVELVVAGFDVEALGFDSADALNDLPDLADGDKSEFEQITFTLHREQAAVVRDAVAAAKTLGDYVDTGNENANGNGIARVCELFLGEYGDGVR